MMHGLGCRRVAVAVLACSLGFGCTVSDATGSEDARVASTAGTLKIGLLFDHSGSLGSFGRTGDDGARLARDHLAAAGLHVELASADTATDVAIAVREARRLVDDEGVQALIGPLGSAAALAVARQVAIPAGIPMITPTATSPALTDLEDEGLVFRTTASDAAQAPVLARLAADEGFRNVGVLYQDDTYGRGLSEAFERLFVGTVVRVPVAAEQPSFRAELEQLASGGAEALVAMTYVPEATTYLHEARALGLFDRFLLVDATASIDLVEALGVETVEGIKGTAPEGAVPELAGRSTVPTTAAFDAAFEAAFDRAPVSGLEASAYDITICLGLAAARAGLDDSRALAGALPDVCGGIGEVYGPGEPSIVAGLDALRAGRPINYDGASNALEWDAAGDLAVGSVIIWQFAAGEIVEQARIPFGVAPSSPAVVAGGD